MLKFQSCYDVFIVIFGILSLSFVVGEVEDANSKSVLLFKTVSAIEGDTVDLPCNIMESIKLLNYKDNQFDMVWKINDTILNIKTDEKYTLTSTLGLHIENLTIEDSANYSCEIKVGTFLNKQTYRLLVSDEDEELTSTMLPETTETESTTEPETTSPEITKTEITTEITTPTQETKQEISEIEENSTESLQLKLEEELRELGEVLSQVREKQQKIEKFVTERLSDLENNTKTIQQTFEQRFSKFENKVTNVQKVFENTVKKMTIAQPESNGNGASNIHNETVATKKVVKGNLVFEYVWLVPNIDEEIEKATEYNGTYRLESNRFYIVVPGYRMRILLYPNIRLSGNIGLFAGLVPGDYDDVLPWPYRYDFQLSIVSNKPNIVDDTGTIKISTTNCQKSMFLKPETENPLTCGFRDFISHKKLKIKADAFKIHGSMLIRMRVIPN